MSQGIPGERLKVSFCMNTGFGPDVPGIVLFWNSNSIRLYCHQVLALTCGILALFGLMVLAFRNIRFSKLRILSNWMDGLGLLVLFFTVATGILMSLLNPWGTSWFAAAGSKYLWSLVLLNPNLDPVSGAPPLIQLHLVFGFILIGIAPYTQLAHSLLFPLGYLWRFKRSTFKVQGSKLKVQN
jgi:nitrate reductase gamma subunit